MTNMVSSKKIICTCGHEEDRHYECTYGCIACKCKKFIESDKKITIYHYTDAGAIEILDAFDEIYRKLDEKDARIIMARIRMEREFASGYRCSVCGLHDNPDCATGC